MPGIERELLPHRWDKTKVVELFWAKPEGNGPFPAIPFIHGYQDPPRPGGSVFARAGRLGLMAKRGYVAAALSQPGYGNSGGPPDFCGPFTQQAARVALDFLRRQTFVKPGKVALFGYRPRRHRRGYGRDARSEPRGRRAGRRRLRLLYLAPNISRHRFEYCRGGGYFIRGWLGRRSIMPRRSRPRCCCCMVAPTSASRSGRPKPSPKN